MTNSQQNNDLDRASIMHSLLLAKRSCPEGIPILLSAVMSDVKDAEIIHRLISHGAEQGVDDSNRAREGICNACICLIGSGIIGTSHESLVAFWGGLLFEITSVFNPCGNWSDLETHFQILMTLGALRLKGESLLASNGMLAAVDRVMQRLDAHLRPSRSLNLLCRASLAAAYAREMASHIPSQSITDASRIRSAFEREPIQEWDLAFVNQGTERILQTGVAEIRDVLNKSLREIPAGGIEVR